MNTIGLATLMRMGCICAKESLTINNRRFYIRSRLGEGGFSIIDLLEDARTHQLYALKRITCHGSRDERIAMQEVEIMQALRHSGLVPMEENAMITVGQHVQSHDMITEVLIVMPYYKRGTLQEKIDALSRQFDQLSEDQIWKIFLGICNALTVMHHHNPPYAHRDIKPGNIMTKDDGSPVLMDLGSATKAQVEIKNRRDGQTLQDEAAERCSMLYRAPELFNVEPGTTIDERTDIWSLGCVLYAMAYLESPFEQAYQHGDSIALAVIGGNVKFPQNTRYSSSVHEVITECMTVNPAERPFIDNILQKVQPLASSSSDSV